MIRADHDINAYVAELDRVDAAPSDGVDWLKTIRAEASERFRELGLPTTKDEPWRYTNVSPIAKGNFRKTGKGDVTIDSQQLESFVFGDIEAGHSVSATRRKEMGQLTRPAAEIQNFGLWGQVLQY